MKKLVPFLISLLIVSGLQAQNLVPNQSFEEYDTCPNDVAQIQRALAWYYCGYSPDYFNSCDTFWVSVPYNLIGYQYSSDGIAYAGIIVYSGALLNLREFMGAQLISPMIIGQKYYVSFQVSFTINENPCVCIATNKIGAKFSTVSNNTLDVFTSNPTLINNFAQVFSDSIIKDTLNWTTISGSFVADSAYKYIIIGNFFDDANTDTSIVNLDSVNISECSSYYYIDNIYVSTDSTMNVVNNNIQGNIKIFPNPAIDSIHINGLMATSDGTTVKIYDLLGELKNEYRINQSENIININTLQQGIYIVKIFTPDQTISQEIIVTK